MTALTGSSPRFNKKCLNKNSAASTRLGSELPGINASCGSLRSLYRAYEIAQYARRNGADASCIALSVGAL